MTRCDPDKRAGRSPPLARWWPFARPVAAAVALCLLPIGIGWAAAEQPSGNPTVGKMLATSCMSCHGEKAQGANIKGQKIVGKKLAGDSAYWEPAVFKRAVLEGIDDQKRKMKIMPVFGKTGFLNPKGQVPTDTDIQNIQAYLKTLGPAE